MSGEVKAEEEENEDVGVDARATEVEVEAKLLNEISVIDRLLTNVNDESTITNTIETDLEFLCNNLRKRQLFEVILSELSLKEMLIR